MFKEAFITENTNTLQSNGLIFLDNREIILFATPSIHLLCDVSTNILGWNISDIIQLSDSVEHYCEKKMIEIHTEKKRLFCYFYKTDATNPELTGNSPISYIISLSDASISDSAYVEFKEIVDDFFDGVLITDENANVHYINESYTRNTGTPIQEYLGKNLKDFLNPIYFKQSAAVLAAQEKTTVSLHHTTPNNNNIIATGTPVFDQKGNIKRIIVVTHNLSEIYDLRDEILKSKNEELLHFNYLQERNNQDGNRLIVASEEMQKIYLAAKRLSNFDTTVLITGPSGAGKEEVAKYIHDNSSRKDERFVAINCNTINDNLLESELFGYVGGTFTGANRNGKAGLFEKANGGTLFLDEIGDISPSFQAKLLRVLETKKISRIGSVEEIPINVRIIAATNKDLQKMVLEEKFRDDLYYRLNIVQIKVPPLKDRVADLKPLATMFLDRYNYQYGQKKQLTPEVLHEMELYHWPGNIRELKNVIENIVVLSNNEYIQLSDLPWEPRSSSAIKEFFSSDTPMQELSYKDAIAKADKAILLKAQEKYGSTRKMAVALQIDQSTIVKKMKKYGISPK